MILVLIETDAGGIAESSLETLTFARELADRTSRGPVEIVVAGPLPGETLDAVAQRAGDYGVATVHHGADERLAAYSAAAWAAATVTAARAGSADLIVSTGTPRGSEVLAHVSARMDLAMAANAVDIVGTDPLVVARQVMGGSALEEMQLSSTPAAVMVAGHAREPRPADSPAVATVVAFEPELTDADLVARVVRTEAKESDDTSALTSARVVVGAGRGAGSADGFGDLLELVDLLGGALGVSRVVTSLGWRPHHEQVGQTGSRISPDVYIACGISGAIQHWAGCQSARTIIAINTDADAPMVTRATYAAIGDLHEIVPAINAELRRRH